MDDAKDKQVMVFDAAHNHIFSHGQAAASGAEIFLAGTTDIRETRKREETVCDGVDEVVRDLDTATLRGNVNQMSSRSAAARGATRCVISGR
jgi:hypothetical protein